MEYNDAFFVEGAWDGELNNCNFDESLVFMGSGGILKENSITFVSPCNTLEAIYSIKVKDNYFFSNSISFLLEFTNEDLDINYMDYENDILTISDGIDSYERNLILKSGRNIEIHYFENIKVNIDLEVKRTPKHEPPKFSSFQEYYAYLVKKLQEVNLNFTSINRVKRYEPIVFTSNGYDSVACAVLGKKINCNEAIVFESKKKKEDSGKQIVEMLGYQNIIEKDELDYLETNTTEEFVANGELGTSIYFSAVEKELEGKFVLFGGHGDWVWDKNIEPNNKILRSFFPGTARKEFRLRVGFHLIVVPFFSVQSHYDLHEISNSDEMKPWSLNNDYDRPIPRRIVEEQGIPREMFGIEKDGGVGSSIRFLGINHLKKVMPPASYEMFKQYYYENKKYRNKGFKFFNRSIHYSLYILKIVLQQKKIISSFKEPKRKYACSPWAPSYLFNWGVETVRKNYQLKEIEK